MYPKQKTETSLEAIRKNICIDHFEGEKILHESALAEEFGMSRTPIRQILQRLAYERLVETKSGVGTVVVPLDQAKRAADMTSLKGVIEAILLHEVPALSIAAHADVFALSTFASSLKGATAESHYEFFSRLHASLVALIDDPVLSDAFSACHWRAVRWHMLDMSTNADMAYAQIVNLKDLIEGYRDRKGSDLFRRILLHVNASF